MVAKNLTHFITVSAIAFGIFAASIANAQVSDGGEHAEHPNFKDSIEREIVLLGDGAQITLSTDDAEALEHLQSKETPEPRGDNVEISRVLTDDGVVVTITSSNNDEVERIQRRAEDGPRKQGRRGRGGHGCDRGAEGDLE